MDWAENVCSNPDILAKEMEHLNRVLCYNNYPQWLIDKWGKSAKHNPIIHPETGVEIQKCFYISVPYFPGLSESYKKIFKYTPIQVCFKGVNTLKSLLMHPKDKISTDQKKDIVYHWECQADGCNSSYIGETSRALGKRVKKHSKSTTSAILKHCKDFHHPLPSISDFSIIDKDPSQITREAKEAIHIRRLDPNFNQSIGKMSIPHCFDPLISAKLKHPWVGALSQTAPHPVDEIAPPSQIPGLNLTQFILGLLDQMWLNIYLNPPLGHAGLETCSIDPQINWVVCHIFPNRPSSLSPDTNWVVSFLHPHTPKKRYQYMWQHIHTCQA